MKTDTIWLVLFLLSLCGGRAGAQTSGALETGLAEGTVTNTFALPYKIYLPSEYDANSEQTWPLLLFLHGAGERGTNLDAVTLHGPLKLVKAGTNFPFIIVAPQCPADQRWDVVALSALLDQIIAARRVDTNRVYMTGLSMGGFATWSLGTRQPGRFAAIAPICGGGNMIDTVLGSREHAEALRRLPVWAFHGAKDPLVPLAESERMVNALKARGRNPNVQLTVYPESDHDSWTETYANPKFYEWLLAQRLK